MKRILLAAALVGLFVYVVIIFLTGSSNATVAPSCTATDTTAGGWTMVKAQGLEPGNAVIWIRGPVTGIIDDPAGFHAFYTVDTVLVKVTSGGSLKAGSSSVKTTNIPGEIFWRFPDRVPGPYLVAIFNGPHVVECNPITLGSLYDVDTCEPDPPVFTLPGPVTVRGIGAEPNETLKAIVMSDELGYHAEEFDVWADSEGRWWTDPYLLDEDDPAGVYQVTVWRNGETSTGTETSAELVARCSYVGVE